MLPRPTDNGARLAAILPTALTSLALGTGHAPEDALAMVYADGNQEALSEFRVPEHLPPTRSFVTIVVDGLGAANLQAASAYARTLSSLPTRRIETVIPSTTGAALTSLTTARLPGVHGLMGYRIRHPEHGLVTTLKDWDRISEVRSWQRSEPVFRVATHLGARPVAIGRPAHAGGGLTRAILTDAEYLGGQTMADRFAIASDLLRRGDPVFAYLYVDELDKLAHSDGWGSEKWRHRLEQFDSALQDFLRTLPGQVGVVVTADHGVVDVPVERRFVLDEGILPLEGVQAIGGEPRLRSVYLEPGVDPDEFAEQAAKHIGKLGWVGTRRAAVDADWFGSTDAGSASRIGEVLIAARGRNAFMLRSEGESPMHTVGQHGSISDEERGVPLALGGRLADSAFASVLTAIAKLGFAG